MKFIKKIDVWKNKDYYTTFRIWFMNNSYVDVSVDDITMQFVDADSLCKMISSHVASAIMKNISFEIASSVQSGIPNIATASIKFKASNVEEWPTPKQEKHVQSSINGPKVVKDLKQKIPGAMESVKCPVKDCDVEPYDEDKQPLLDVIVHLNDSHRWAREEIADWLDTLDINIKF